MMRTRDVLQSAPPWDATDRSALHVLAAFPEPLDPSELTIVAGDLLWARLERGILTRGGPLRLERLRPPTARALRAAASRPEPPVLYVNAAWRGAGWAVEGDGGEVEILTPAAIEKRAQARTLVVSGYPLPDDVDLGSSDTAPIVVAISAEGEDRLSRVADVLVGLARGIGLAELAEIGGVRVHGPAERWAPGEWSGNALTFDSTCPGAPPPFRKPLAVHERFIALMDALRSDLHAPGRRGAILEGPAGAGKSSYGRLAVRRLMHRFPGGAVGARRGERAASLEDLVEQCAEHLGITPSERGVLHELRRRPALIMLDDCDRVDPEQLMRLIEYTKEISPQAATKLILTATEAPRAVHDLDLVPIPLGHRIANEEERQALAVALAEGLYAGDEGASVQTLNQALARFGAVPGAVERFLKHNEELGLRKKNFMLRLFPPAEGFLERFSGGLSTKLVSFQRQLFDARLSTSDQALMSKMSVFRGPADFDAIEAVCGGRDGDLAARIERLIEERFLELEGSLIQQDRLMNQVAGERLTSTERIAAERRFVEHYLRFLRVRATDVRSVGDQLANLRRALELAKRHATIEPVELAEIARKLVRVLSGRSHFHDAKRILETASDAATDPVETAGLIELMGELLSEEGEYEGAARSFFDASRRWDGVGRPDDRARALRRAGVVLAAAGDLAAARAALEDSDELSPDQTCHAEVLLLRGTLELKADKPEDAEAFFRRSLELRTPDDVAGRAETLNWLGTVAQTENRVDEALQLLNQALEGWKAVGAPEGEARTVRQIEALRARSGFEPVAESGAIPVSEGP
jgi:tetratricopeptide (TPR) repeat protein